MIADRATAPTAPLLELAGITKRFGQLVANNGVDLRIEPGEILGVLGENGAGKSTLMNVISGLLAPDSGTVSVRGREVRFNSPRDAAALGIGMVHQHVLLVPSLTVVENIMLGDARLAPLAPRLRDHAAAIAALASRIGLPIDPWARAGQLDMSSRQRVEILNALYRGAKLLVLDEPTSVLAEVERAHLYDIIRNLKRAGVAVILISHKLDDIFAVCDRVIVMRAGRIVDAAPLMARNRAMLVRAMIGGEAPQALARRPHAKGAVAIEIRNLAIARDNGTSAFAGASFELHYGEILAIAGVEGNGQQELAETIAGLRAPTHGTITLNGTVLAERASARHRRELGLRHLPHDRHVSGMLQQRPLDENFALSHWFDRRWARYGWMRRSFARRQVEETRERFQLRGSTREPMAALSGGNQQKLVVGRELWGEPRVLIAAHPTRGLDVRTVAQLQELLLRKRDQGLAILLISSDLGEIWQIADRVAVLSRGALHGPVSIEQTSSEQIGAWITGT
ncbi:MAG: ABC transporter ATP-binding protein [Alphaproteobacteria bacterium]